MSLSSIIKTRLNAEIHAGLSEFRKRTVEHAQNRKMQQQSPSSRSNLTRFLSALHDAAKNKGRVADVLSAFCDTRDVFVAMAEAFILSGAHTRMKGYEGREKTLGVGDIAYVTMAMKASGVDFEMLRIKDTEKVVDQGPPSHGPICVAATADPHEGGTAFVPLPLQLLDPTGAYGSLRTLNLLLESKRNKMREVNETLIGNLLMIKETHKGVIADVRDATIELEAGRIDLRRSHKHLGALLREHAAKADSVLQVKANINELVGEKVRFRSLLDQRKKAFESECLEETAAAAAEMKRMKVVAGEFVGRAAAASAMLRVAVGEEAAAETKAASARTKMAAAFAKEAAAQSKTVEAGAKMAAARAMCVEADAQRASAAAKAAEADGRWRAAEAKATEAGVRIDLAEAKIAYAIRADAEADARAMALDDRSRGWEEEEEAAGARLYESRRRLEMVECEIVTVIGAYNNASTGLSLWGEVMEKTAKRVRDLCA